MGGERPRRELKCQLTCAMWCRHFSIRDQKLYDRLPGIIAAHYFPRSCLTVLKTGYF